MAATAGGDLSARWTLFVANAAIGLLSLILWAVMVFGLLVGAVSLFSSWHADPATAFEGWTPAHQWFDILPLIVSPTAATVSAMSAIRMRRRLAQWVLRLSAGYAVVIASLTIGIIAMRGAPD